MIVMFRQSECIKSSDGWKFNKCSDALVCTVIGSLRMVSTVIHTF